METIGFFYLSAILEGQNTQKFVLSLLSPEIFRPYDRTIYEYVAEYVRTYGVLPQKETVESACDVVFPEPHEVAEFYLERVKKQYIVDSIRKSIDNVSQYIQNDKQYDGLDYLLKQYNTISAHLNKSFVLDSGDVEALLCHKYTSSRTISFGWKTLDEQIGIIEPGLISMAARTAAGKTLSMLYMAIHACNSQQNKVLFVNVEMSIRTIYERLLCLLYPLNLSMLEQGKYPTDELRPLFADFKQKYPSDTFKIIDSTFQLNVYDIIALCKQYQPHILFIDGAYLLKTQSKYMDATSSVGEICHQLMTQVVRGMNIPVVCSWQLNRKSTEVDMSAVGTEHIGLSDSIGQLSRVVLAIQANDSIEAAKSRLIRIIKGSTGQTGEFYIHWKFDDDGIDLSEVQNTPHVNQMLYL
jgi:replicative DNA helicase